MTLNICEGCKLNQLNDKFVKYCKLYEHNLYNLYCENYTGTETISPQEITNKYVLENVDNDWQRFKINNEVVVEGHTLYAEDILKALNIDYEFKEVREYE